MLFAHFLSMHSLTKYQVPYKLPSFHKELLLIQELKARIQLELVKNNLPHFLYSYFVLKLCIFVSKKEKGI